jgi:uncharacterized protein YacL
MALIILRCVLLLVAAGAGASIVQSSLLEGSPEWVSWLVFAGVMALALAVIGVDVAFPKKRIDTISCVYFGLVVGLFLTYVVGIALAPLLQTLGDRLLEGTENREQMANLIQGIIQLVLGMILCYTCVSLLIQTKDDFRFIIPYVEFSKEVKGLKPYILDTSVVVDGRIADVVETRVLDNQIIMPRFILTELQNIADSSDKLRRSRGRRGLDILNRLRSNEKVDLRIHDRELPEMSGQPVDMKLVLLAKHLEGKIVTGDYNLNKVARLHNVEVINLNDLANALKPIFLPGERVRVKLVKPGEEEGQGVGYLDDGTMIVVENGRNYVGKQVEIEVTSILQTSAGRMIFGRFSALAESG